MKRCFQIHPTDNVATALEDIAAGEVVNVVGPSAATLSVRADVRFGHKIAIQPIAAGVPVVKYGVPVGLATREIAPGEWVHLHNCRSQVDQRSSDLDLQTGSRRETAYE